MELDESGYPQPTGRFETLAADTVILALGQETDTAFLRAVPGVEFERDGTVKVSASLMTGCPGVFAGGDMVPAERTVTVGVGHGKRAAREIDAWLRGTSLERPPKHPPATFDLLNLWYFGDAATRAAARAGAVRARRGLRGGARRPDGADATFEARAGACRAGTAASATAASAPARRTRSSSSARAPVPLRLRPLHGLPGLLRAVPVHSIEMFPEPR